ncbi:hypothetical protein QUB80_10640 [Chlorogloeopsis sp. ULAP01]|uniref:hypothetical protein n=1 Tax=Chlorogloeopsis sp. ULAP01 TaxID=3056483 RepID=UPI0025AA6CE2|nr:hypothetical protein [Chlorogloeopsis sp. ULAP01]MDM9381160.1 hypothetical protein [Chlorogloeopsis sp. ULAP01]
MAYLGCAKQADRELDFFYVPCPIHSRQSLPTEALRVLYLEAALACGKPLCVYGRLRHVYASSFMPGNPYFRLSTTLREAGLRPSTCLQQSPVEEDSPLETLQERWLTTALASVQASLADSVKPWVRLKTATLELLVR